MLRFFCKASGVGVGPWVTSLCLILGWSSAIGQSVTFEPLINAKSVVSLVELGDRVFGGLDEGGLVVWNRLDPSQYTRINAGTELSGNQVSDLAWTGNNLWVATRDGGLTRISEDGSDLVFRQFSSNLGGINLTAVTGAIIGGSEWVFYAMDGIGIGRVIDGLSGNTYSAEQDGLISNNVSAMQFLDGDLFVATDVGISRFANNTFTDQNTGLSSLVVRDLTLDQSGNLLAATNSGVYRWNAGSQSWTNIGGTGTAVYSIASGPAGTFAIGLTGSAYIMSEYDGSTWTSVPLPNPRTYAVASGQDLWVGGRILETGMAPQVGFGWLGMRTATGDFDTWRLDASLVRNAGGVTFGADSSPWIGSYNADAISHLTDSGWVSTYEVASAANDSSGLFNQGANVLSMTTGPDGTVYAGQYTQGVVRFDPVTGSSQLMSPANCGLEGGYIVNMVTHPDGPVFFMHDQGNVEKVEVLVDPVHWRNPDNWLVLPTGDGGLGIGEDIWDVVVQRKDVIWFAVAGTGLVRWDINGDSLGPDDSITWLDTSDDRWDPPVDTFGGPIGDPKEAISLALAPDRSIWVGGNGVVRFNYSPDDTTASLVEYFGTKTSPFAEGLINGDVRDLTVDPRGDLWVATASGLNRGITENGHTSFTAWFDLGNYLGNSSYGSLFSADTIVALPGGFYRRIEADPNGTKILLSSNRGAVLFEPDEIINGQDDPVQSPVYLYPNPFKPGEGDGMLKFGGIGADAINGDPAFVAIYNLDGQRVFPSEELDDQGFSADVGFWDGSNKSWKNVTTGMYLVRLTYGGTTTVLPLAIVR